MNLYPPFERNLGLVNFSKGVIESADKVSGHCGIAMTPPDLGVTKLCKFPSKLANRDFKGVTKVSLGCHRGSFVGG